MTPLCGGIAKSLNSDTARQTTFDRGLDEIWCEERERDRHVDLTHAAFLTCRDLLNVGHGARHDLVKPATTSCDGVDKARPSLDPRWTDFTFGATPCGIRICLDFWMAASAMELTVTRVVRAVVTSSADFNRIADDSAWTSMRATCSGFFATVHMRSGVRIPFERQAPGEKIDDSVFDIARRNAGNRPD